MTHYLAIDFGGTRTRAGWFNESLQLLYRNETASRVRDSVEAVLLRISDTARSVIPPGETPQMVGISAPGPLDAQSGVIHHAKTLPGWQNIPLAQYVSEAIDSVPVVMQNDANLAALAEYHFGAGRGCNPLIYLTISTGIGGGAVIDGKLFTGWRGLAIEPGHIPLTMPDGRVCRLEELASGTALGNIARQRLEQYQGVSLLSQVDFIDGKTVGETAQKGDPLALSIVQEAGHYLGLGLVTLLHLFNPQAIVIGGSVALLGGLIFDTAREAIYANLLDSAFYDDGLIRLAAMGDDVCLYGAAYYAKSLSREG